MAKEEKKEEMRPGKLELKTKLTIRKFAADEAYKKDEPYEVSKDEGNLGLNEGIQELWDLACGLGTPTAFNNANAQAGVGDNTTAAAATQTSLQAVAIKTAWVASTAYALGALVRPVT
ncbi:MAG: hypothetical protein KKF98_16870, partial [Bacteroidetes bacterium]|nr:hypothetical protein [Bacteroidota bacterium]